jgi:uncharacterized protein YgiM (DUF1202 family)
VKRAVALALFAAACAAPPPPPPAPAPADPPPASAPTPAEERAVGTVRVNASTLNVRAAASASSEIVSRARRGEKLAVLEDSGSWLRVRLGDGTTGWVAAQHIVREGAAARPRRGCPPDSDYSFIKTPKPAFSDSSAHGIVIVEAGVDVKGNVVSTRVVSNTTGDPSLAVLAERELREARFAPPVRNCVAKAFIYTYKRAF